MMPTPKKSGQRRALALSGADTMIPRQDLFKLVGKGNVQRIQELARVYAAMGVRDAQRLTEAQIWDKPQFTVSDVCKITGATPKAIEHFLNPSRGLVSLMGDWVNPGTGKRRIFTGAQVLKIAAAYTMNHIGVPLRRSIDLSDQVARRAKCSTIELVLQTEMSIVTYRMSNGDWASIPIYRGMTEKPNLPVAAQVLDVDRMIDQVLAQLQAIVADPRVHGAAHPPVIMNVGDVE